MGEHENFLITIYYEARGTLLQCALQVLRSDMPEPVNEFPMEPASRDWLRDKLPLHVRNCGPIVKVERIFEIAVA